MGNYPKRGEIYYIAPSYAETTTEMWSGRPGIIVSNNQNNKFSNNVMVIYLTTKPRGNYPTNVPIKATGTPSTAICDQINTVAKERLGSDSFVCTQKEMDAVDAGIRVAFGFGLSDVSGTAEQTERTQDSSELFKARIERDLYKEMYQELLKQTLGVVK